MGVELHVAVQPGLRPARHSAGDVRHVAFGSVYFHEPNGTLVEIATYRPDLADDEDPATIGEKLVLTPSPRRSASI
jgi:glyoxalase family protein